MGNMSSLYSLGFYSIRLYRMFILGSLGLYIVRLYRLLITVSLALYSLQLCSQACFNLMQYHLMLYLLWSDSLTFCNLTPIRPHRIRP